MTTDLKYYVYAYLRNDGTPYYIGKGCARRAYDRNHRAHVPRDRAKIILLETGLSEIGAFALERRLIRWHGRKDIGTGILRNLTDGGEGPVGVIRTEEQNRKLSEALTGYKRGPMSDEEKQKRARGMFGKKRSDEFKEKHRGANNGRHNDTRYYFQHVETGEVIHKTQYEMRIEHGFSNGKVAALLKGKRNSHKGWRLINV